MLRDWRIGASALIHQEQPMFLFVGSDWRMQIAFLLPQAVGRIAWRSDVVSVQETYNKMVAYRENSRKVYYQDGMGQWSSTVSDFSHSRNHMSTLETFLVIASGAGLLVSSRQKLGMLLIFCSTQNSSHGKNYLAQNAGSAKVKNPG